MALSPDGALRAMVGGRDYGQSQFNRATQAQRQPGSAFKTFVYLAAFEAGWHPDSRVIDEPVTVGKWSPANYDGKYRGEITLRQGFAQSINTAAVKLGQSVGTKTVVERAQSLGLTGIQGGDASVVLGTSETTLLQMTSAYAVLANRGRAVFPYGITKVSDAAGRVLFQQSEFEGALLVEAQPLAKIVDVMTATVEWGTGKAARLERPAAGKTGTSQDFRDAWFVGYTAELVTGVWFGNDDNSPTDRVTGGGLPAETWAAFSARALAGESAKPLPGASTPLEPVGAPPEAVAGGSDDFIGGLLNSLRGVLSGEEGSSGSQGGGGLLRNTPDYPEEDRPGGQ